MRVIGGELRGRRFKAGRDYSIRPTSDKVRESIFDILQGRIEGRRVLDLFAGTGAFGIEALSRGAASTTFVDSSREAISLIRENIKNLSLGEHATVLKLEIPGQLKRILVGATPSGCPDKGGHGGPPLRETGFDLVFMDPPYGKGLVEATLAEIGRLDLLAPGVTIVAEHSSRENIGRSDSRVAPTITLIDRRVYSTTAVSFYERA